MLARREMLCGVKLRTICFIIGCCHMVSSVVDICCHLVTVGFVTNGFQCDVDVENLKKISSLHYLEPILLVLNLGIHGFYPFPHIVRNQYNTYVEYMAVTSIQRCYPGILHVYITDVLNFMINLIWLKFVISYMKAVQKNDHSSMRMFIKLAIVKLVMQIMYLGYYPMSLSSVMNFETFWLLKFLDIVIASYILMVIRRYANILKAESEALKVIDKPPSYFECLIGGQTVVTEVKCEKDATINIEEGQKETEAPKETQKI